MAKWYDPFLTKDERRLQVGQKGIRARNRAKEMGVNTGEPKQVPNDKSTAVSRSESDNLRRRNARMKEPGNYTPITATEDTKQRIMSALSKPTATKRGVMYNMNSNKESRKKR